MNYPPQSICAFQIDANISHPTGKKLNNDALKEKTGINE